MSGGKLMTDAELSGALGIRAVTARSLVRRTRWHCKRGNHLPRDEVPFEYVAEHEEPDPGSSLPLVPPFSTPSSPAQGGRRSWSPFRRAG